MNTDEENTPTTPRPLGFWLRVVDGLISRAFAQAFETEGVDRRDWMLLNAVSGDVQNPWVAARLERGGKRVRALADRGWIERSDDRWTLTDEGRAAKERLGATVEGIRAKVAGAVSPEDYATMTASLEAIATELGWDGTGPRGFGRRFGRPGFGRGFGRRGFGPGFGPRFAHAGFDPEHGFDAGHGFGPRPGFGPGRGFGPGDGFDPRHGSAHGEPCHPHHRGHGHGKGGRHGERAYERGFDAGFARGRDAAASDSAA